MLPFFSIKFKDKAFQLQDVAGYVLEFVFTYVDIVDRCYMLRHGICVELHTCDLLRYGICADIEKCYRMLQVQVTLWNL